MGGGGATLVVTIGGGIVLVRTIGGGVTTGGGVCG
jgi:hypothetical protein